MRTTSSSQRSLSSQQKSQQNVEIIAEEAQYFIYEKFTAPHFVFLAITMILPLVLIVTFGALLQPVALPVCYTREKWNWKNLLCRNNTNFTLSQFSLGTDGPYVHNKLLKRRDTECF